ncbi:MAG TPA: PEGA domain-containing protein [Polyangiaceae bacterium]|nr:PEGA domain-containing protein [Polyangiaceae bacterium]
MRRFFVFGALAASLGGCQLSAYPPPTVSLRVRGNVPDAQVTIDDIPVGALAFVAARGVALPPGRHRISVERTGYFAWDALIEARETPVFLQIDMVPVPD